MGRLGALWRRRDTARTSTLVLSVVFVGVLVLYFLVRPISSNERNPQRTQPSTPASSSRTTTPPPTASRPAPSPSESDGGGSPSTGVSTTVGAGPSTTSPAPSTSAVTSGVPPSAPVSSPASRTTLYGSVPATRGSSGTG